MPKRQARGLDLLDDKERAEVEDNFRKTISQVFGGAAVLAGAAFAYLQFTDQRQASHDLLISNQVAKGFELLGKYEDKAIAERLGGIYALEGVMNDRTSLQYHKPVLEALCAFVRDSTKDRSDDQQPTSDIQAALTVIGRRAAGEGQTVIGRRTAGEEEPDEPDLHDAHISKAILPGANLIGARLGGAHLNGALLAGAHLNGAYLSGAILSDAHLDDADLTCVKGLTKEQLEKACGEPKGLDKIDPPLHSAPTMKPCPPFP